jgi:magnesium chelatase accessory protein
MAPLLAQHYTVVMPDLPGHAFTTLHAKHAPSLPNMSQDVRRLLAHLALWPTAILGHSAGAAVAAHLSLHAPSQAPVVVGLNPAWLPQPGASQWLFAPTAKLMALNPYSGRLVANHLAKPWVVAKLLQSTGSQIGAAGLDDYSRLVSSPTHVHGVLSMMAAWNLDSLKNRLGQIGHVLLHIGENDQTVPVSLAHEAVRCMPSATLILKPGLGHLAHEEQPQSTASEILQWLKQQGR